jgi:hypothetical protein
MTDEQILSQDDIDAIVADKANDQLSSGSVKHDSEKAGNRTDCLPINKSIPSKTETEVNKTLPSRKIQAAPPSQNEIEVLRATVTALATRLAHLENQVMKSDKSFRCDIKSNFRCNSCKSHGRVAMYLKCTSCGEEQWVGWWPKK